jgi:hypothetical protein
LSSGRALHGSRQPIEDTTVKLPPTHAVCETNRSRDTSFTNTATMSIQQGMAKLWNPLVHITDRPRCVAAIDNCESLSKVVLGLT